MKSRAGFERIYLSPPDVGDLEVALIGRAIESNWVAPVGPDLDLFEQEIAKCTGRLHGVGTSSGTAALHLALRELGVGAGDEVLVSTFTFIASASPICQLGATPIFIDSEEETWNMDPDLVEEFLEDRVRIGKVPKVAIVVDLYGQCAQYDRLLPIFQRFGIEVIEDAAEALGGSRGDSPAGSFGSLGIVSFNGNKIITSSSGGMLLTDAASVADHARKLASQAREPVPHYQHEELGYNYRLSNLLAAFGRGQLATLQQRIERRRKVAAIYRELVSSLPGVEPAPVGQMNIPNYWLSCIQIEPEIADVNVVRNGLEDVNIESRNLWKPLHLQPVFEDAVAVGGSTAASLFQKGLALPSGSSMDDAQLDRVCNRLAELLGGTT